MKYWLLAIVSWTVAFSLSLVLFRIRMRHNVTRLYGLAMWKTWR